MERHKALRRLALLFALVTAAFFVLGAQAASAASIEICKASTNGMSGRSFQYSVSGGPSVTVVGGRCSGAIQLPANTNVTITEQQSSPATEVAAIQVRPSLWQVSQNLATRSVVVNVGSSTSSGIVTFTNQPAGGNVGTLKVCKLTFTPAYLGRLFSFSVNGGPLVSTEANDAFGDPATWSCRILGTFQVGSHVTVTEQIPVGTEVRFIDADPAGALVDFNTTTGTGIYEIQAGTTVALFDDEPIPPSGTGYIEVCKDAGFIYDGYRDPDVVGPFDFTITDAAGVTYHATALANQCSAPILVNAGIVTVTETAVANINLVDVFTIPEERLLTTNLVNRTADVEVVASDDPASETEVHFVNVHARGQLKICKTLGPGSADLIGQRFFFRLGGDFDSGMVASFEPKELAITAAATTQCIIVGYFPIGATITVTEENPGEFIDVAGEGPITIAAGVNTVTITNTARGLLEICKERVPLDTQPTFQFRVDGGGLINVRANTCTLPMRVSVGNHTVTEVASTNFDLLGFFVEPTGNVVSGSLATRSVTVAVQYGQDTTVTAVNRIKTGQVKVCKVIPITSQDSLGAKLFAYRVQFSDGTAETLGPITPGQCTFYTAPRPILQPNGQPTNVTVTEAPISAVPPFTVVSVTAIGIRGTLVWPFNGNPLQANFNLGPGPNIITYTNKARDP